jgi:hypothetical protein
LDGSRPVTTFAGRARGCECRAQVKADHAGGPQELFWSQCRESGRPDRQYYGISAARGRCTKESGWLMSTTACLGVQIVRTERYSRSLAIHAGESPQQPLPESPDPLRRSRARPASCIRFVARRLPTVWRPARLLGKRRRRSCVGSYSRPAFFKAR